MTRFVVALAMALGCAQMAIAGGTIDAKITDSDGFAEGSLMIARWNGVEYEHLSSRPLFRGKARFAVAPGKYRATIRYTETFPRQEQAETDIVIEDATVHPLDMHFEKGWIDLYVHDNDCAARSTVHYSRWDESTQTFEPLISFALRDPISYRTTALAPGRYRVDVNYKETVPNIEMAWGEFEIEGGKIVEKQGHFVYAPDRREVPVVGAAG